MAHVEPKLASAEVAVFLPVRERGGRCPRLAWLGHIGHRPLLPRPTPAWGGVQLLMEGASYNKSAVIITRENEQS